jgi:hypothetical protein
MDINGPSLPPIGDLDHENVALGPDFPVGRERGVEPYLAPVDLTDGCANLKGRADRGRCQVIDLERGGDEPLQRLNLKIDSISTGLGCRGRRGAVAVDQGCDQPAVQVIGKPARVVIPRREMTDALIAVPIAFLSSARVHSGGHSRNNGNNFPDSNPERLSDSLHSFMLDVSHPIEHNLSMHRSGQTGSRAGVT